MTAPIQYSRGRAITDISPEVLTAEDFAAFTDAVLADTATVKGRQYIAAPFQSNGKGKPRRCKDCVLPSAFIALDLDGFQDREAWHATVDALQAVRGFAYTTYSSTHDAPRARVILAASREMDRIERIRVSEATAHWLIAQVGPGRIKFDSSVYKAEQPLFTPPEGAESYRFDGTPVDVPEMLFARRASESQHHANEDSPRVRSSIDWQQKSAEIRSALRSLDIESIGYERWLTVGMALHSGSEGASDGFDLWHEWSSGELAGAEPCNYKGREDCRRKWDSFKKTLDGPHISLNSLFKFANETGWRWPESGIPIVTQVKAINDWPEPSALPDLRPPVEAFNPDALPRVLYPWLMDIAERMQCPPDYPAIGAMVSLGAVIGRRVGIKPKRHDDWLELPNLWGAVIGPPGFMKTPALAEATRPLMAIENKARATFLRDQQTKEDDAELRDAQLKHLRKKLQSTAVGHGERSADEISDRIAALKAEGEPGVCPRYLVNDATVEKLGEILAANPNGVLLFRDELVGWLKSLDREGSENARPFFLEAWNGKGGYTYDRIGRGTVHIEAACVSVLGGIQPGPLADYVSGAIASGKGADGLLQRLQLLVWPDDSSEWRNVDRWPDTVARAKAHELFESMSNLDACAVGAKYEDGLAIPFLQFDAAAQELFTEWRSELENRKLRGGEVEAIESHLSKYRKLVPALALICQLADGGGGPIAEEALLRACTWADYLESHARRVYGAAMHPEVTAAHALAGKIQSGALSDGFSPKNVYRNNWKHLGKAATYKGIDLLEDLDWLRTETVQTGGRPTIRCWINPRLVTSR